MKRLLPLLVPLVLSATVSAAAAGAIFPRVRSYDGRFADVAADSWYYPYVAAGYDYALFNGRGAHLFDPDAAVTVGELAALSARIRAESEGEKIADTRPWSVAPYVAYLRQRGAFDESLAPHLAEQATRTQLAALFAAALPAGCCDDRNALLITDAYASGDFISDVDEYTPYQPQILWMYRQGLLVGTDGNGRFCPAQTVNRAEAAAVAVRAVEPALRLTPGWSVTPRWSAAGTTLRDLVPMPDHVTCAPAYDDEAAIDALVRRMLALDSHTITLRYPTALSQRDAQIIADRFSACVKRYCEQMYNHITVTRYFNSGRATLTFSASGCTNSELSRYRKAAMSRAVEIHDMLWETGQLTETMRQHEIALVYYLWLCDHCVYDYDALENDDSLSHIAYSALLNGKAVCDGYTGAYNLFLKLEGIDCRAVYNDEHIWTVATLDGTTCHIDVTWGDRADRQASLAYFAMTPEVSRQLHPW